MGTIKRLEIWGFKRFSHLCIDFNDKTNIIVGENESGKSTILEAINIVLNQWYKNTDKSIIKELLNIDSISTFQSAPSIKNLPSIKIELELILSDDDRVSHLYWGANKTDIHTGAYGICFECKLDEESINLLRGEILLGKLPYEYYTLSWKTFQGNPYNLLKKPINSILVDTAATEAWSSFNYFTKTLFNSKYEEETKTRARNDFRDSVGNVISNLNLDDIDDNQRFGINDRKLVLDNLLSVFDNGIPLENRGKGIENLIKTRISLDKVQNKISTVLIEEPENHLSFSTMLKMIKEIEVRANVCQVIITTHSNMIASRLDLRNVLWVCNNTVVSLKDVEEKVALYFTKVDNNSFLTMLLAHYVILVEGATEYILLSEFYKNLFGRSLEEDKITVISCNGLSYKHYLDIAERASKKVAVLTDNDKNQENIKDMSKYNEEHERQHIFMSDDLEQWTWEASLYELNKEKLNSLIEVQADAEYKYHGISYGPTLGKMLNNKTETAYKVLTKSDLILEIPNYIKEALKWVRK